MNSPTFLLTFTKNLTFKGTRKTRLYSSGKRDPHRLFLLNRRIPVQPRHFLFPHRSFTFFHDFDKEKYNFALGLKLDLHLEVAGELCFCFGRKSSIVCPAKHVCGDHACFGH